MPGWSDLVRRLGHQRWFAALGARITGFDRRIQQLTRGRLTVIGRSSVPHLLLTVTGRRTGQPRTVPLVYARDGERYVVTASNWGRETHPLWSANLIADPEAVISVRGRDIPVRARLTAGEERARVWPLVTAVWPAYDTYAARSGRDIRVFVLEPRDLPPDR